MTTVYHVKTLQFEAVRRAAFCTVDIIAKRQDYLQSTHNSRLPITATDQNILIFFGRFSAGQNSASRNFFNGFLANKNLAANWPIGCGCNIDPGK